MILIIDQVLTNFYSPNMKKYTAVKNLSFYMWNLFTSWILCYYFTFAQKLLYRKKLSKMYPGKSLVLPKSLATFLKRERS